MACGPTQRSQGTFLFPHPQSPCPWSSPRLQEDKSTSCCCGFSQLNLSSTCALQALPSSCPAMIHGSSSALPYMGSWNVPSPALGISQCQEVPFSLLCHQPCLLPWSPAHAGHRPSLPHSAPHTTVPWGAPVPYHPLPHRCHPQARVPSLYGKPWSFPCPQIMVHAQQDRLSREHFPADPDMGSGCGAATSLCLILTKMVIFI